MNTQNILEFYGSKMSLKLDSSEFYDFELGKIDFDYNTEVLNLDRQIVYNTLKINNSLSNMDCSRDLITLNEFDNTINDGDYIYSGLTITLDYSDFVSYFSSTYEHTILNNDVFVFTGITNEIHYFTISNYNITNQPLFGVYGYYLDEDDNILLTSEGDALIFTDEITFPYSLLDVSDDSPILTNDDEFLMVNDFMNSSSELINMFSKQIISCLNKLEDEDNCCPQSPKLNAKPWAYKFDTGSGTDYCNPIIKRRTEKGWTLDFIFNRKNQPWSSGGVFYYIGVRGENNLNNYADNNLSFQFTSDRRIKWVSYHYSGNCSTNGYEEDFYISSGQTPQLCVTDPNKDFNITIVFDRYKRYVDCDLENNGGFNDLLGWEVEDYEDTVITAVTSTQIATYNSTTEKLNKKWWNEKQRRLGILKIYLNGRPIYKIENWEEVIPSKRGNQPFIQSWGGGTGLMYDIHNSVSCFNVKSIKYYEEPLDFVHVYHDFKYRFNLYDFEVCGDECVDNVYSL
jgi:hypothetical protein